MKEMQRCKRHEMEGFLFSHTHPQKQFISPNTQALLTLPTFMITEGRQTCYPHLGISPFTEIIKPRLRTAAPQKWSLSNVWLHYRLSEKKV